MVVLPFASLSGVPRDEALADGVTDTLITSLAKIEGLQVVSATTSRSYRGRTISVPEVGRELGVDAVIEGSLARDGDRIVLNAQLIDAHSDSHLWAETYERRFEHLLDLQVEVAQSIGAAVGHRFAPTPVAPLRQPDPGDRASILRWRLRTGGEIWAEPVVEAETAVVASRDGWVYAAATTTGEERWRLRIGDQVVASPAVRDGRVFVAAHEGVVVAAGVGDGRELWRHRLDTSVEAALAVGPGVVVACDEGGLVVALDASSGRRLWSWQAGDGASGVSAAGGLVVAVRFDGEVTALDAVDGREVWSTPVARWLEHPAAVAGDRVLVPAADEHLVALDLVGGRELWRTRIAAPSTPSVWRDRVLVGGDGQAVRALDLESGAELWSFDTHGSVATPIVLDGTVVAGARDNAVYGLDPWTGALQWRIVLETWATTAAAGLDGGFVVGALDGVVSCFDLPGGGSSPVAARSDDGFRLAPDRPDESARSWEIVLDDRSRRRPSLRWRVEAGGFAELAPAVTAEAVFAAVGPELAAFDAGDGRELWRHRCAGPVGTSVLVVDDLVVVGDRAGSVTALDRRGGAERWRFRTSGDVISTPEVVGDALVFGSRDRFLYALELGSGRERWRRELDIVNTAATAADGVVYVPSRGDRLWAVSAADGWIRWSAATSDWVVAEPVVWRDRVIVAACDGTVAAFARADGSAIWQASAGDDVYYRPALVDGAVVVGSADFHVYAVEADTGRERWRRRTGNRVLSSVSAWDGLVFAGSQDRQLWALETATGVPAWRLRTSGIVGSPAVADGIIAFGSADGFLYCLDLPR